MHSTDLDDAGTGTRLEVKIKADSHKLAEVERMRSFLKGVATAIGAEALREPVIDDVVLCLRDLGKEPWADEGGITGIITLSVSHVAMVVPGYAAAHTWPEHDDKKILDEDGEAQITIYSCRPFDPEVAKAVIIEMYSPSKIQITDRSEDLAWKD